MLFLWLACLFTTTLGITAREHHQLEQDCARTCVKAANRVRCDNTCRDALRKRLERGGGIASQSASKIAVASHQQQQQLRKPVLLRKQSMPPPQVTNPGARKRRQRKHHAPLPKSMRHVPNGGRAVRPQQRRRRHS